MSERGERLKRTREITERHGLEMVEKYEAGASTLDLADQYGIANATVWKTIQRNGGQLRGRNPGVRKGRETVREHGAEIAAEYLGGATLAAVAKQYDLTISTVAKTVRAHGGTVRKPGYGSVPPPTGADNHAWRGGAHVRADGYRLVRVDGGYVLEHRLVMAGMINRPLDPTETVHHIDGDRLNNEPSNLQLRSGRHGKGIHLRCGDCGSRNVVPQEL